MFRGAPLPSDAELDIYGFVAAESGSIAPQARADELDEHKEAVWTGLLQNWAETVTTAPAQLRHLVYAGIPHRLRPLAWSALSMADVERALRPGLFGQLVAQPEAAAPACEQIRLDLNRTLNTHVMYREGAAGQDELFRVLKAYSLYNPEISYCQGMSFIAAALLLLAEPEEAFWLFVAFIRSCGSIHDRGMSGMKSVSENFDKLISLHCPAVGALFAQHGVHVLMFATSWFITGHVYSMPCWSTVLRCLDVIFLEGYEAVSRFALARIVVEEPFLVRCTSFETILTHFRHIPAERVCPYRSDFMSIARRLPISALLEQAAAAVQADADADAAATASAAAASSIAASTPTPAGPASATPRRGAAPAPGPSILDRFLSPRRGTPASSRRTQPTSMQIATPARLASTSATQSATPLRTPTRAARPATVLVTSSPPIYGTDPNDAAAEAYRDFSTPKRRLGSARHGTDSAEASPEATEMTELSSRVHGKRRVLRSSPRPLSPLNK